MNQNKKLTPLSLRYMKTVRLFLISIGSWPGKIFKGKERKFKIYSGLFTFQSSIAAIGQVYLIKDSYQSLPFSLLGEVYALLFLNILTLYRSTLPFTETYGRIIKKFVSEFHLIHFKFKGGHFETMYATVNKISHYFTIFTVTMMFTGMSLFNILPFYNNFKNGVFTRNATSNTTKQFSVQYKFPGFDENDHFAFSTCLNVWFSYACTILVCVNDLLLTLIVFQIIGHIQTLNYNFLNFPQPGSCLPESYAESGGNSIIDNNNYKFSVEENKIIHEKLVGCINHHRLIVRFVKEISQTFGPMLATNYLYHLLGCCLLLLECSTGEPGALARYGPLTVIIFSQLIQISVMFEIVGTKSENIMQGVYSVPWVSMDVRNQRSVHILLHRVQRPMCITAMGLTKVGVQTMLQILKTTISYFAFLRSID